MEPVVLALAALRVAAFVAYTLEMAALIALVIENFVVLNMDLALVARSSLVAMCDNKCKDLGTWIAVAASWFVVVSYNC